MHTVTRSAVRLVLLALVLSTAPVRAETINCTAITALPAVITVQGIYCFTGNLSTAMTSGNAIDIQTNNVVLDLNGFKLGGLLAGPSTSAIGIRALNRANITIKNGTIRGFEQGISLEGSGQGHVVEDIRADRNTLIGIEVQGSGTIVRNNQVVATGGKTAPTPGSAVDAFGIFVTGTGPQVLNNAVIQTVKQGGGQASGIFLSGVTDGLAVNNRITEADVGIDYAGGSTGKYRDTLTSGVPTPFIGGTDAGNNH